MAKAMQVLADFEEEMSEEEKKGWENCLDELDEPENRLAKEEMGKYLVNKEGLREKNPEMVIGMYYLDSNWDNFCGLISKNIAESQRARTAIERLFTPSTPSSPSPRTLQPSRRVSVSLAPRFVPRTRSAPKTKSPAASLTPSQRTPQQPSTPNLLSSIHRTRSKANAEKPQKKSPVIARHHSQLPVTMKLRAAYLASMEVMEKLEK